MNVYLREDPEDNPLITSKSLGKDCGRKQIRLWSICPGNKEKEQGGGEGGNLPLKVYQPVSKNILLFFCVSMERKPLYQLLSVGTGGDDETHSEH